MHLCVHVFIFACIFLCLHVRTCVDVFVCACVFVRLIMFSCVYVFFLHVHMCVCNCACVCACDPVCLCGCQDDSVCAYPVECVHNQLKMCLRVDAYEFIHLHVYSCV